MRNSDKYLTVTALACLLVTSATGQEDDKKKKAIDQMRQVANAMKQCPEQKTTYRDVCSIRYSYQGPPTNLEWDVVPSKTVRSPFQGIVEFTLSSRSEEGPQPNQSTDVRERCISSTPVNPQALLQEQKDILEKGPKWRAGHYRYEFDLGSDTAELVKMLWVVTDRNNNVVTFPVTDCWRAECPGHGEDHCWVKAARTPPAVR
jgi:hypothetical protein